MTRFSPRAREAEWLGRAAPFDDWRLATDNRYKEMNNYSGQMTRLFLKT
jgi:hypothetical protein